MTPSKFSIRNIYFYLVCFLSIIIFVIGAVQTVGNFLDIVYPDPDSPYKLDRFDKQVQAGNLTSEEAEKKAQEILQLEREWNKVRDIKDLAQSITMLVIAIPLFLFHWQRVANQEG